MELLKYTIDLCYFSADLDILSTSSCISGGLKKIPATSFHAELPLLA